MWSKLSIPSGPSTTRNGPSTPRRARNNVFIAPSADCADARPHLPARVDALRRLFAAVRPGGWLALHEPDFNAVGLSPTSASWQRTWSAFCDAAVAGGWDPGYGARLVSDIEALDLVEVHAEVISHNSPGGAVRARLFAGTLERFWDRMLELGATEEDLEVAQRQLRDPRVTFRAPTLTTAWALQPAAVPQATKEDGGRATSVSRPPTETCDFGRKSASEGRLGGEPTPPGSMISRDRELGRR
jgi:hypothetical protein